jgi:hypothetical protein
MCGRLPVGNRRLSRSASETAANSTESETIRQLNRQATVNAGGSAGPAVP